MIVAGRAHDPIALIHKGIGTLDHIAASIMLFWRKISLCLSLICIDIAYRKTAKKRNHRMSIRIKKDCRGCICVYFLIRNIDL